MLRVLFVLFFFSCRSGFFSFLESPDARHFSCNEDFSHLNPPSPLPSQTIFRWPNYLTLPFSLRKLGPFDIAFVFGCLNHCRHSYHSLSNVHRVWHLSFIVCASLWILFGFKAAEKKVYIVYIFGPLLFYAWNLLFLTMETASQMFPDRSAPYLVSFFRHAPTFPLFQHAMAVFYWNSCIFKSPLAPGSGSKSFKHLFPPFTAWFRQIHFAVAFGLFLSAHKS